MVSQCTEAGFGIVANSFDANFESAPLPAAPAVERLKTVQSGVNMHREHLADAVLFEAGSGAGGYLSDFRSLIGTLRRAIREGRLERVNEKIDGSMSIVFGYDTGGEPFVAYKGGFTRSDQRLVQNAADLNRYYPLDEDGRESGPRKVLRHCLQHLLPQLRECATPRTRRLVFQADVLFHEGDGRRAIDQDTVRIQSNTVPYCIPASDPRYTAISEARLGFAVHTVGRRSLRSDGRSLDMQISSDEKLLQQGARRLTRSSALFVMDPVRENIALGDRPVDLPRIEAEIDALDKRIEMRLRLSSAEFRNEWSKIHLKHVRVFFNTMLQPPRDGEMFREARDGTPCDSERLFAEYLRFVEDRESRARKRLAFASPKQALRATAVLHDYENAVGAARRSEGEMRNIFEMFYEANRIQYLLLPHLKEAFRSKLGGGECEGLMLSSGDAVYKLIDRLAFTLCNNGRWNRGGAPTLDALPAPLNCWRPGAAFLVCGWRVPHQGHFEMLQSVLQDPTIKELHILVSPKSPRPKALTRATLGVAETKSEVRNRDYRCLLSRDLRREIAQHLVAGLDDNRVTFHMLSPSLFWEHVRRGAHNGESEKIRFIIGQKEIDTERYDDEFVRLGEQIEPLVVPPCAEGLSATKVRSQLRELVLSGSRSARRALHQALNFVDSRSTRNKLIDAMCAEWKRVDRRAQKLLKQEDEALRQRRSKKSKK